MRFITTLLIFIFSFFLSYSQLRLPAVISSGMVLQQNDSVAIWGWANPGEAIDINTGWDNKTYQAASLNIGKWKTKIKTPVAGGPYTITVKGWSNYIILSDVMIGEVWLCSGQSNMEWSFYNGAKYIKEELPVCYNNNIRFFHIPRTSSNYPQEDVHATWKVCDSNSLKAFSAVGYYFGKKLNKELNVPIGLINSSWGGTPAESWTPAEVINNNTVLKNASDKLVEVPWGPVKPGMNFNGMIAPVIPFNIAGAIWYQGESNVPNGGTYSKLLTTMIDAWRKQWNKEFPFYYVQIAPFVYEKPYGGSVVQEEQTKATAHLNTGMVVITDLIDSVTDIHPSNKLDVGNRLANWALAETYNKTGLFYKHPQYKGMEIVKDKIVLSFDNVPTGLIAKGKQITGFFVSGESNEWLPAEAKIENDKIIVWNKKLKTPAQVRFGFGNGVVGNVFGKEGLPLCPFRTDNWPVE